MGMGMLFMDCGVFEELNCVGPQQLSNHSWGLKIGVSALALMAQRSCQALTTAMALSFRSW
jgi:hypothetical protein